jgi:hypothetical protein
MIANQGRRQARFGRLDKTDEDFGTHSCPVRSLRGLPIAPLHRPKFTVEKNFLQEQKCECLSTRPKIHAGYRFYSSMPVALPPFYGAVGGGQQPSIDDALADGQTDGLML